MKRPAFQTWALILGFAFLYGPIVSIVVYSFNASRLVTVWGGFSTKWYFALAEDGPLLRAAGLSLQVAALSATLAVVVGTAAGYAMARFGRFRGRALFSGMLSAPLVMPEIISAISLLLLFVAMAQLVGWPAERGLITLVLAHASFTLSFVAVIVQSRVAEMDRALEEAAQDLGARPWNVFLLVTLPIISPALVSGWLLAFSLSLDDVVTSAFVSGPGSTTLPLIVFSSVKLGVSPEINALGSIIVAIVGLATLVGGYSLMRRERSRMRYARAAEAAA